MKITSKYVKTVCREPQGIGGTGGRGLYSPFKEIVDLENLLGKLKLATGPYRRLSLGKKETLDIQGIEKPLSNVKSFEK